LTDPLAQNAAPMTDEKEKELEDTRMALWEHLDELRGAILRSLLVVGIGLCVTYNYAGRLMHFLEKPLLDVLPKDQAKLYFTGVADKFMVYLKVSLLASVVLCAPYLLFEIWKFVAPALYRHEKRFVAPFLILGTLAFFVGMVFSYTIVIPYGYKFLIEFGADSPTEQAIITLADYFDLTVKMLLALGIVFEMPVVMLLLGKMGIVRAEFLTHYRRHAFLVISVGSAILTPSPDAFTLLLVMVPLYFLYELSIVGVRWVQKPLA
jgi:sec-independent protein translocase protein TatC